MGNAAAPIAVNPALLDAIVDPVLLLDAQWDVAYVNEAGARVLGRTDVASLAGRNIWEEFPEAVGSRFYAEYHRARREQSPRVFTEHYPPMGAWFEVRAYPAGDQVLILFRDVTAVKAREDHLEDLADEQDRLRRVATAVAASHKGRHEVFELIASEAAGLTDAELASVARWDPGAHYRVLGSFGDAAFLSQAKDEPVPILRGSALEQARRTQRPLAISDMQATGMQGRMTHAGVRGLVIVPVIVDGDFWGALSVAGHTAWPHPQRFVERLQRFAELAALAVSRAEAFARLSHQAQIDGHTGLLNSSTFHARLDAQAASSRATGEPFCVAVIDVDRFKSVNDVYGHRVGDEVLRHAAAVLRRRLRAEDVVGRVGGDELAVLMRGVDAAAALVLIEDARQAIAAVDAALPVSVTASAGIAPWTAAATGESLFCQADDALYWAKAHGGDAAWIYDPAVVRALAPEARQQLVDRGQALAGLRALARAIDAKDTSTRQHSQRVAGLAREIALASGWSEKRAELLHEAGLVHDVGKIGVPDAILLKPGRLTPEEYEIVKRHAALGAEIVEGMLSSEQVIWVRHHHERPDGRGYPDALTDDRISEGAAILALADTWDVMTSARSYSPPKDPVSALAECRGLAGRQFRAAVVEALGRVLGQLRQAA